VLAKAHPTAPGGTATSHTDGCAWTSHPQRLAKWRLSTVMSPRTVITGRRTPRLSPTSALRFRAPSSQMRELERPLVEFYQRCFNAELAESS